jgi:hypothetical protein
VAFLLEKPTPIGTWKLAFLGDADAPDLGDPDRDGAETLLEYALGLNPSLSDAGLMPKAELRSYAEGERLSVLVPRDPAHDDITVVVEVSPDLQDPWTIVTESTAGAPFAGPGVVGGDGPGPGFKTVEIRDVADAGSGEQRFLRIRVIR